MISFLLLCGQPPQNLWGSQLQVDGSDLTGVAGFSHKSVRTCRWAGWPCFRAWCQWSWGILTFTWSPNITAGNSRLAHTAAVRFQENERNYPKPHDTGLETDTTLHLPHSLVKASSRGRKRDFTICAKSYKLTCKRGVDAGRAKLELSFQMIYPAFLKI